MDQLLKKRLIKISEQIERLKQAEEPYLNLKASKDSNFAVMFARTEGSIKERECQVHQSTEWRVFMSALVTAEVDYQRERRVLDLLFKALDCEYLSFKIENQAINRQGSQT